MNEIIATILAGAPFTALVLVLVGACIVYATAIAYAWEKKKYGVMAIMIAMGLIGISYVLGLCM